MRSKSTEPVIEIVGPMSKIAGAKLRLTAQLAAGADVSKVAWDGAPINSANPLEADVPIDQSTRQDVTVKYDGKACRSCRVWPVWATVSMKSTSADNLSADNGADIIRPGTKWSEDFGGTNRLGGVDRESSTQLSPYFVAGRVEFRGLISPAGVTAVVPDEFWMFTRMRSSRVFQNGMKNIALSRDNVPDPSASVYLDLDPNPDGAIYDLDVPGITGAAGGHSAEAYSNFEQYVSMKNSCSGAIYRPCSATLKWSYRARVDFDKPANKVELNSLIGSDVALPANAFYPQR